MLKTIFSRQNLLPLITALIWGSSFVAQSVGSETMRPFAFNAVRCVFTIAFLIPLSLISDSIKKKQAKKAGENSDVFKTNWKNLLIGGTLCGVALTLAINLQQFGIGDSGAGKAGFITALYVVLVPVFGLVLKKHVPSRVWLSVVLAVAGLYLLCIKAGFTIEKSDILLLCCAVLFAVQILIVDHYIETVDGIKLSCMQFAVVGVLSGICMFAFEGLPTMEAVKASIVPLLYTGILSSGVAYTLQIIAQRNANPTVLSLILSLESVFATIFGAIILHEKMSGREYIGCILMFTAVIISQLPGKEEIRDKKKKLEEAADAEFLEDKKARIENK